MRERAVPGPGGRAGRRTVEGAGSSKLGQRRIDIEIGLNVYNLTNGDDLLPESVVGNRVLPVCGEALAASHKRQAELMIRMRY